MFVGAPKVLPEQQVDTKYWATEVAKTIPWPSNSKSLGSG
jgi:hypothetical protein